MNSEMREYVAALRDREHRFHGMGGHYVAEVIRGELEAILARTEAGADGAIYQMMATDEDVDEDGNVRPDDPRMWMDHSREEYERLNNHPSVRSRIVYTHPQDASGDAAPVLFGRNSGGDWYVDTDTKSICVDVDFDPARQLSLVLKQDGSVAWSIFVQEPDSSTTKATGPSVMNPGFYEALSYIAMQAKEAK